MTTTANRPIFAALSADDAESQLTEMESLCMNCYAKGNTRLLLTRIPYYKEVILSSFECDSCHFKNNDIQPAQRIEPYGVLINVQILDSKDLNRQIVKSSYGTIRIKELDFEQTSSGENGLLTTIEGFFDSITENINKTMKQIEETIDELNKKSKESSIDDNDKQTISQFELQKEKLYEFLNRVESLRNLSQTFHFEVDDPSGNSFIENPKAPCRDEQMKIKKYRRTVEQDKSLGMEEEIKEDASKLGEPENIKDEVLNFQTNCPSCDSACDTHMKLTEIPYFKEVIVMATSCDVCGHKSNEVKSGTGIAPQGIRYRLIMNDPIDLNRDILVSETSSFSIPDLDFELSESRSIGGRFTTVEGILTTLKSELTNMIMPFSCGDSHDPKSDKNYVKLFVDDISAVIAGEKFVTIVLDDPAGNCYLQNICAPEPDPQLIVEHYPRSDDQDDLLGIKDMKLENYAAHS
ncbi:unnamed protein product [Rotaria magnacalcarata]|uniref:Zinc finger ZPR1-type domain-containing protein n=1 Tax=Rotaria magnacalcarata TaxID=392030 RepID=A0A816L9Q1_9BILA|nr:unnamed protein product [Rotaria magnacalcarata]CAF1958345.1 unnamed protein product [Rotaria magnacalcarata]CAF3781793.1 unnamed protein product [Rotaria magnacalcarata]CAF3803929.1 unnamed protein product [Rotaria magnacalcarata]